MRPSRQAVQRICRAISEKTSRRWLYLDERELVKLINQHLVGWANYFQLGQVSAAYHAVEQHARYRLRKWLRKKHQLASSAKARFPDDYLHQVLGLVKLAKLPRCVPWATA